MPTKILIAGYYGHGNAGDEAILATIIEDLRALRPGLEFTVVSGNPTRTSQDLGVHAIDKQDPRRLIEGIRGADLVLLGGGGLFQDYWEVQVDTVLTSRQGGLPYYVTFPLLARLLNRPTMIYAVGIGPLRTSLGRRLTRIAFEWSQGATVRDPSSLAMLEEIGIDSSPIELVADPAFRHPRASDQRIDSFLRSYALDPNQPLIGLSVRPWSFGVSPSRWEGEVAAALDDLSQASEAQVVFLPFHADPKGEEDDRAVARRILARMEQRDRVLLIEDPMPPGLLAGVLSRCDKVLAMRFHAVLFALRAQVAVVNLAYDPKTSVLMDQAGLKHLALAPESWHREFIISALDEAVPPQLDETELEVLSQLAGLSAEHALNVLDSGAPEASEAEELVYELLLDKSLAMIDLEQTVDNVRRQLWELTSQKTALEEALQSMQELRAEHRQRVEAMKGERDAVREIGTERELRIETLEEALAASRQQLEDRSRITVELVQLHKFKATLRRRLDQDLEELRSRGEIKLQELTRKLTELQVLFRNLEEHWTSTRALAGSSLDRISDLTRDWGDTSLDIHSVLERLESLTTTTLEHLEWLSTVKEDLRLNLREPSSPAKSVPTDTEEVEASRERLRAFEQERDQHEVYRQRAHHLLRLERALSIQIVYRFWHFIGRWLPEGSFRRRLYRRTRNAFARLLGLGASKQVVPGPTPGPSETPDFLDDMTRFEQQIRDRGASQVHVFFSGTRFQENEGQRPTQLTRELARRGLPVVFCYWRWSTEERCAQDRLEDGILQLPIDFATDTPNVLAEAFTGLRRLAWFEFPHPSFFHLVAALNSAGWMTLYDVLDDWEEFHRVGQAVWYDEDFEAYLINSVDAVYAINDVLADRIRRLGGQRVEIVPNGLLPGIEEVHTSIEVQPGEITVGYFGYLAGAWFDWELVAEAARQRPGWKFYMIGYGENPQKVQVPPNVYLLGKKPQRELSAHAVHWDVAIIPFKPDPLAAGADPIKTYEYLAMGLPVITTGVNPPPGAENLITRTEGVEGFIAAIETAARQDSADEVAQRRRFAAHSTWGHRLDAILASIHEQHQRVSEKAHLFMDPTLP